MTIQKLSNINPIPGDDKAFVTMEYKDVPTGFKFENLVIDSEAYPLITEKWNDLITAATRHYWHFEIVGKTIADWFSDLQNTLDCNRDTLERVLKVYDDDIANPVLGRTRTVTYNLKDSAESELEAGTEEINVPLDDPTNDQASRKTKSTGKNGGSVEKTGTETEELSDLGVRPNYEALNGFIDNNRSYQTIFIDFFKENFMIKECLKW